VVTEDDVFVVYTTPADFSEVRKALEAQNLVFLEASVQMVPQNKVELSEEDTAKFLKMIDLLEDNDDVQEVWHNVILPEEEDED
jgi:transcriptional/translational regulatory protein YebC/TACO1